MRQLLDLEPAWGDHDAFFVTEDTPLGRSLAAKRKAYYVAHAAFGQARLGYPFKMIAAALRNLFQSASAIFRERPDVVLTTGAGAAFFVVLFGRLAGAKVVLVESFARFGHPSLFARVAGPLAHRRIVQSMALARIWPDAKVFDPFRLLAGPRPPKEHLLFATVGATLPFDRLTGAVTELKNEGRIPEHLIVQAGIGGLRPEGIETHEMLSFEQMQDNFRRADIVVCHGGTGSLVMALREGCHVIAMPRLFERAEHYDDHQQEITAAFAKRGLIEVANSKEELARALESVRTKPAVMATTDPAELIDYLRTLFASWGRSPSRAARSTAS